MKWYQTIGVVLMCSLLTGSGFAIWAEDTKPSAEKKQTDNTPEKQTDKAASKDNSSRYQALIAGLTIFMLAIFVGFEIITKVPPTLHTPLMSGSNAISGITLVGAVIVAGMSIKGGWWFSYTLGAIAVALATVNVAGGFLVTHRMLAMFKKKK